MSDEYTIDELAAHTSVPSRTIRYYQSKGALPKPERRGRKAIYTEQHVERLALIGTLQDRGLQIKAIRDLMKQVDAGEIRIEDWLGLQDQLAASWESPVLYTTDELDEMIDQPGLLAELVDARVLERQSDRYLARSPSLLKVLVRMVDAGISSSVALESTRLVRKRLRKLANDLAKHLLDHAGEGFGGDGSPAQLEAALDAMRPLSQAAVRAIFAAEMEQTLRGLAESRALTKR